MNYYIMNVLYNNTITTNQLSLYSKNFKFVKIKFLKHNTFQQQLKLENIVYHNTKDYIITFNVFNITSKFKITPKFIYQNF